MPVAQVVDEGVLNGLVATLAHIKGPGDGRGDEVRLGERGQGDQEDTIGEPGAQGGRNR